MRFEYSSRAVVDLRKISADTRRMFGDHVAKALEARILAVIKRISMVPTSAPEVRGRPGVHVVPLIRYPFKIFYRVFEDHVRIQHIRHSARRSWVGRE